MAGIAEWEAHTQGLIERFGPAVVAVGARGSGVVIGEGLVLTNSHNVGGEMVAVTLAEGRQAEGQLRGADVDGDLAVIEVDTAGVQAPEWAPDGVAHGAVVVAFARGRRGGLRATVGTISAVDQRFRGPGGRRITGGVEHTAPLARGSSGGPLVDSAGRLVALNTHRLPGGFYLARPMDASVRATIDALGRGESPQRRQLGIGVAPASVANRLRAAVGLEPRDGVLVRAVADDSPAARAGLRSGDLIVGAGGNAVTTVDELHQALAASGAQETLTLDVVRGTDEVSVTVEFSGGGG